MLDEEWRTRAKCLLDNDNPNSHNPDFYPEVGAKAEMRQRAKGKCFMCAVRSDCLEWAMETEGAASTEHRYGILGALDPAERAAEYRNRRNEAAAR